MAATRQLRAERAGLVHDTPSTVRRDVYQVPIPAGANDIAFFEDNSWEKDSLFVQFTTTPAGLDAFLARLGTHREHLRDGLVAVDVPPRLAGHVDWRFPPGHHWAGVTLRSRNLRPAHEITVNLDSPHRPVVFTISTIRFVHGRHSTASPARPAGDPFATRPRQRGAGTRVRG
ncbi:hypothetical protein ACIRPX_18110 [Streptomyces sp. NPDC101225]|uniref:hypothetical protein n=1 Tax=Streptomyces sp. NPDC101225 TaxID=3366135 RepID=UPI0037FA2E42